MAKIRYNLFVKKLIGEQNGYTFQNSRSGAVMMQGQRNDRNRNANQNAAKLCYMQSKSRWLSLAPGTRAAWKLFAKTYPQASNRNPLKFLSGYQLFVKRITYLYLNYGISEDYSQPPLMQSLAQVPVAFTVAASGNCIDCTVAYIRNFGLLPKAGDYLLLKVIPYAVKSGQFFAIHTATILCQAVYLDGLFLSLSFPNALEQIVYSIYLSKPVNQSVNYVGTKTRYMGCFTSKTFLELVDTPDSFVGQQNKIVSVKADQSGLEFTVLPEGGLYFDVHFMFDAASSVSYPSPYALKFIAMIHQQLNAPILSIALNSNLAQYQVLTVTADAAGVVTLTGTWL